MQKEHQVLELKQSVQHPVELHLNGQLSPVADWSRLISRFAVELTELAHENNEN